MGYNATVSPPEWNELISKSASDRPKDGRASMTMVCGPKSSGKSTFSKMLVNRLLTVSQAQRTDSCIAFLDLDPGQPEFSPPGQLSLLLLSEPNFGPPFSHPNSSKSGTKLIRAHSISAVSPSSDPDFYMACAMDLLSCSRNLQLSASLVINTPGWILGTGLELLCKLITQARPTQVVYMSQDGPLEAIESLQVAANPISISTLPSQPSENLPRTSAQLRTMQYMSYFHLDPTSPAKYNWNSNTITSMVPLEVKYAGKGAGIFGILCLGEQPPARIVRDAIDGSLVAVVVVEDLNVLLSSKYKENRQDGNTLLLQTPEGIPYFNPANSFSLDPACSHTIGLAIVRGIDVRQQRLQLLTPIPAWSIKDTRDSEKAVILVSGKLDIPGWAYLEALYKKDTSIEEDNRLWESHEATPDSGDAEGDSDVKGDYREYTDSFENTPWVELLQGDKGREIGSRVWRVRRDLGKTSGGY
jgi:polynucleotide 5'-hydroxyl-kinase GRC3/NOL9